MEFFLVTWLFPVRGHLVEDSSCEGGKPPTQTRLTSTRTPMDHGEERAETVFPDQAQAKHTASIGYDDFSGRLFPVLLRCQISNDSGILG